MTDSLELFVVRSGGCKKMKEDRFHRAPSGKCKRALFLLVLVLESLPLAAQVGRSGITGTVTDPSGAAVVGAKVSVRNESTNVEVTTQTGESANYFVRGLPVGSYTLTVQAPGFETLVTRHVQTEVDKTSSVDAKLQLGAATQSVS